MITNTALTALEPLVGAWQIKISNADFLDPDAHLTGQLTVQWIDGQALLALRSVIADGPPTSTQIIGRNQDSSDFTVLYADDRGVSRVYTMTFNTQQWILSRSDPGFHQRFEARLLDDGTRIEGAWSTSHDNGTT